MSNMPLLLNSTPDSDLYLLFAGSTIIEFRLLQSEKGVSPILVVELGIVIEVRVLQPTKADFPILVR